MCNTERRVCKNRGQRIMKVENEKYVNTNDSF